jgi:hypothetical protein
MSASLAQGLGIKFGGGSFYFANKRAAVGEFAQVSPTEVEIGSRFQLLRRGKVKGDGDAKTE